VRRRSGVGHAVWVGSGRLPEPGPGRRVVVDAMSWNMRARRGRAKTTAQSTAHYLLALERLAAREADGSKGGLYGPEGPVRRASFARPVADQERGLSVLIAPLDGWALDLGAYVRRVMTATELDLGRRLEWAAVNHPDPHPHAHVVLRGLSSASRKLPVDDYVIKAIRGHAEQIGPQGFGRSDDDVARPWDEIFQARFTPWDVRLAEVAKDNRIAFEALSGDRIWRRVLRAWR
jgi:hypothetical protein